MSTHKNIYLSLCQVFQHSRGLLGRPSTREIVNTHWQSLHALRETFVMLKGKNGGGHENSHLLRIACSLKGSTHSYLRLSKAHISTDESIHWS